MDKDCVHGASSKLTAHKHMFLWILTIALQGAVLAHLVHVFEVGLVGVGGGVHPRTLPWS